MKKILIIVAVIVTTIGAMAQPPKGVYTEIKADAIAINGFVKDSGIINIPPCFCCDNAYQLPQPVINGTAGPACSCNPITFSTTSCPGATFNWTVKDNLNNTIAFTGNGTANITLSYSLAQQVASMATSLTITLQLRCGQKVVTSTKVLALKPIPPAAINFSLNTDASGNYTATASTIAPSNGNGWTLKEVTCPGPNPCSWVAGPIKWQSPGNNVTIPTGVLVKGRCYVLTHYVNVCSPTWVGGSCTVYKATCFTVSGNQLMMKPANIINEKPALPTMEMLQETNIKN